MILQKPILRDQIKAYLEQEILNNRIKQQDKLSLVDISKKLSVSVTPIREALGQLQQSGIVEVIPNRGFFIPKLDLEVAKQIYPIIGEMEAMAIVNSTHIDHLFPKLAKLENRITESRGAKKVQYDNEFHEVLISNNSNTVLLKIIQDLKLRVIFYETAYMGASGFEDKSRKAHADILTKVKQDDTDGAADLIRAHWADSLQFVEAFLERVN